MNVRKLRALLGIRRPGKATDADDPDVAAALAEARRDPAHRDYLEKQAAFHDSMQQAARKIPVPAELRAAILRRGKVIVAPRRWWNPARLAAAAAIVLIAAVLGLWPRPKAENSFATFRSRMVSTVLRQYTMDIETNEMSAVRRFLSEHHAPADYALTPGLAKLPVTGAGVIRWQGQLASMVCLETPGKRTLFLFVVDASTVKGAPGETPQWAEVNKLSTGSWSHAGKSYIVAGSEGLVVLKQQL